MTELLPETRAFLKDWLDWVDRGAPEGGPYYRTYGLCTNICHYNPIPFEEISDNLSNIFSSRYPFGLANYSSRAREKTQHLDPARLEWVCNALEEI